MRALALVVLILGPALAGCIGDEEGDGPLAAPRDRSEALLAMTAEGPDHDHALPAHHQVAYNTHLLDQAPLRDGEHAPSIHALAIHEDRLFAAHTLGHDPGVTILDVSDPTEIAVLGRWTSPEATWGDRSVAVSEDGRYAFLGTERPSNTQPLNGGVRMLDVSDPANIVEVAFAPMARGSHTVDTITLDGTTYVYAIDYGVTILRVVEGPDGPALVDAGRYALLPPDALLETPTELDPMGQAAYARLNVIGHDARAAHDPELGPLLYVAFAFHGVHVLSLEAPEAPVQLARWVPPHEGFPWYVHSVEVEWLGDQRLMVVGQEAVFAHHDERPSPIWVLDATDLDDIQLLGTWENPAGTPAQGLLFSAHWLRLEDGIAYLAHYHGGVWVLDVSTPERQAAPHVLGAYLAATPRSLELDPDCCVRGQMNVVPYTYDVAVRGGVVFVGDWNSGVSAVAVTDWMRGG